MRIEELIGFIIIGVILFFSIGACFNKYHTQHKELIPGVVSATGDIYRISKRGTGEYCVDVYVGDYRQKESDSKWNEIICSDAKDRAVYYLNLYLEVDKNHDKHVQVVGIVVP